MSHIAIFDIGKTNKKLFVFNEDYQIVYEKSEQFAEIMDEDGFPCEDVFLLVKWVQASLRELLQLADYQIAAVNFSAYGASFVYLDERGKILTPLYNYLKPYPEKLQRYFFEKYGNQQLICSETASPFLGNLNSGLQLFRLKYEQPHIFNQMKYALHLPQFMSFAMTGVSHCELTSVGCHTMLWDFSKSRLNGTHDNWESAKNGYHHWVNEEAITAKFPVLTSSSTTCKASIEGRNLAVGIGLHDSSAALIPYLESFPDPFVLLSTGTWNIAMNPFNDRPLTQSELEQDCLCYQSYQGQPVKASRLFAGHEYEAAMREMGLSGELIREFEDLKNLGDKAGEYLHFIVQLVKKQEVAIKLISEGTPVQQLFVDGGFSKNEIFMTLLAEAFSGLKVFASEVAQASAIGAAVAIHEVWNHQRIPSNLIKLKHYSVP